MMAAAAFRPFKPVSIAAALFGLLGCAAAPVAAEADPAASATTSSTVVSAKVAGPEGVTAELTRVEVADGSLLLAVLRSPKALDATKLEARFLDREFPFYPAPGPASEKESVYESVIAVPHSHPAGRAELEIRLAGKATSSLKLSFTVVEGQYRSEVLKVDAKHVNPPKRELARIQRESAEIGAIYREIRRVRLWSGPFVLPVDSAVTSPFGTRRVYNGQMRSFHQGLDLRAQVGTPIRAPSDGVVVLAKDLYFTGNTVILDHGYGLFTIYGHLSKLKVRKGQKVKTGRLLGLAGMTGRVSGPHLHWGAVVQRVKVNPMDLLQVLR